MARLVFAVGAMVLVLMFCAMALVAWSLSMWTRTSDYRYEDTAAWAVLGSIGLYFIYYESRFLLVGLIGNARAAAAAVAKADASVLRDALERCERAGCPPWVRASVEAWFGSDNRTSTRLDLLSRLYAYSASSADPYESRRAVNDLRLVIRGDAESKQ